METIMSRPSSCLLALLVSVAFLQTVVSIGVNYGTHADNLPKPAQVAQFLKEKTTIDRVKIFDMNPDIIRGFANTGISVSITVPNGQIPSLANADNARQWVLANIKPFYPQTKINHLLVGNEILHPGTSEQEKQNLVGAMRSLHQALKGAGMEAIKVTTPHSLAIIEKTDQPSDCQFVPVWGQSILKPMLEFHRMTKSPFMVNPYPYFTWNAGNNSFILWHPNPGRFDKATNQKYDNMYDFLLDAIFTAMKKMGYGDVEIAVGEVGWPSAGEPQLTQVNVENARWHNWNILQKSESGKGTPLMPGRKFETFIFALFNENQKTGSIAEKNFGLFRPDFSPVYDIGIMRGKQNGQPGTPVPTPKQPESPKPAPAQGNDKPKASAAQVPVKAGQPWCVPKSDACVKKLQNAIDWACSNGLDCKPIQAGGACFNPNNVHAHAAYVTNTWYKFKDGTCDFGGSATLTNSMPSYATCKLH